MGLLYKKEISKNKSVINIENLRIFFHIINCIYISLICSGRVTLTTVPNVFPQELKLLHTSIKVLTPSSEI